MTRPSEEAESKRVSGFSRSLDGFLIIYFNRFSGVPVNYFSLFIKLYWAIHTDMKGTDTHIWVAKCISTIKRLTSCQRRTDGQTDRQTVMWVDRRIDGCLKWWTEGCIDWFIDDSLFSLYRFEIRTRMDLLSDTTGYSTKRFVTSCDNAAISVIEFLD